MLAQLQRQENLSTLLVGKQINKVIIGNSVPPLPKLKYNCLRIPWFYLGHTCEENKISMQERKLKLHVHGYIIQGSLTEKQLHVH